MLPPARTPSNPKKRREKAMDKRRPQKPKTYTRIRAYVYMHARVLALAATKSRAQKKKKRNLVVQTRKLLEPGTASSRYHRGGRQTRQATQTTDKKLPTQVSSQMETKEKKEESKQGNAQIKESKKMKKQFHTSHQISHRFILPSPEHRHRPS
ncbi:hypothetical protein BDY21DRAFT_39376 [Lineolata rhizophorae]|uniref:Uncharacterized protein n=1 Tax=Lineolata rhizophorae TaxID=578093 RepID=A0A6A6NXT8_9PEZI|nr:hypothetical protein BDY21DRAFT_39376 [Lineolata rhizophorae]